MLSKNKGLWSCPECGREFKARIKKHNCGPSAPERYFEKAPKELAILFFDLQKAVKTLGPVEVIFRPLYCLFRNKRNFCWVVIQKKRLRVSMVLPKAIPHPIFTKIVPFSKNRVAQGAFLENKAEIRVLKPFLKMAYHGK